MRLDESGYLPRSVRPALDLALSDTPVVCVLGPRQCGKSTLARHCEPPRSYFSLDDRNYLDLALNDPQGFVDQLPEQVTIDEIQRAPELTLAIKRSVDAHRAPGRFLLTGSADLLQLPRLADSLAGRMEIIELHPLTESEKERSPGGFLADWLENGVKPSLRGSAHPAPSELPRRLVAGGYPEAVRRTPNRARTWQKQYLRSIIERDIRDVASVKDGGDVGRLLEYLSDQTAELVNVTAIAKGLGHTRPTVERYLGVLEKLFLIRRLPAWHGNRNKRLIKAPKLHLCDSGLAAALCDLRADQWNEARSRFGHLLESFILQQLIAMGGWTEDRLHFFHYRDKDRIEVDMVIESGSHIWGVEVKAAATVQRTDAKGLLRIADIVGTGFQGGIILYDGAETVAIHREKRIFAVPISRLWEL